MKKEYKYFLLWLGLFFSLVLIYYLSFYWWWMNTNNSNVSVNTSTKQTKKISYEPSVKWLILNNHVENKEIYLTWNILNIDWKAFSWIFLSFKNTKIYSNWNNFSIDTKNSSWSENKIEINFIKWFTKMKLIWEFYDFDEKNILPDNTYDLGLFLTDDNNYYVIVFENYTEKKQRDDLYAEYNNYVEELKKRYWSDPKRKNELILKTSGTYDIELEKLK